MPLAKADVCDDHFPNAPAHRVTFGWKAFVNRSPFVIDRAAIEPALQLAKQFFAHRKSLPRLAAPAGPKVALRYLAGTLILPYIEARASRLLGWQARAIVAADPGLCYDVDTLEDWQYVTPLLSAN